MSCNKETKSSYKGFRSQPRYVKQGLRVRLDLSALLRTVGSLIAILFISIFTSLVAPFQCNLHPNGRMILGPFSGSINRVLEGF